MKDEHQQMLFVLGTEVTMNGGRHLDVGSFLPMSWQRVESQTLDDELTTS